MSLKAESVKPGLRVLTPNGAGELVSLYKQWVKVELDHLWADNKLAVFEEPDDLVIESNFFLVRIIKLGISDSTLIAGVQTYSSWDECLNVLEEPYSSNETLLALNFQKRIFKSNRKIESENPYQILETGLNVFQLVKGSFYSSMKDVQEAWHKEIDSLAGTTGNMFLCAVLDFENNQIWTKAVFAVTRVISKETYW